MIAADKDALTCDLAETYGIMDWRALPVTLLATLASGLGDDSRIKRKISGQKIGTDTLLLAMMVDLLNYMAWSRTKDGVNGKNRPKSFVNILLGRNQTEKKQEGDLRRFRSPEDFDAEWARLTGGENNG